MNRKRYNKDKGFTLVELVVVLVVVSILAAIAVPYLYGFLDSLNETDVRKDIESIRNYAQNVLYDLYSDMSYNQSGHDSILDTNDITFDTAMHGELNNFKDCDLHNSELAKTIMEKAGFVEGEKWPNFVLLCLGRYDYYTDPTNEQYDPLKAYTVYGIVYQPVENDKVYFLYGDKLEQYKKNNVERVWNTQYQKYYNRIKVDGENIFIQYYLLKSYKKNGKYVTIGNDFWNYVNKQKDYGWN